LLSVTVGIWFVMGTTMPAFTSVVGALREGYWEGTPDGHVPP
jgi:hypothetical protein